MPKSTTSGIPYVMTGDFIGLNSIDFKNTKKISEHDYEMLAKKMKPELGDILFARYASVGLMRYVATSRKFLVSYSCAIIRPNETVNGYFIYVQLQASNKQLEIEKSTKTGSQKNIGIDDMNKFIHIDLPSISEQDKIARIFKVIDGLIAHHQR